MIGRVALLSRPVLAVTWGSKVTKASNIAQHLRKSHVVSYRAAPPPHSKATIIGAEIVGAAMWWWVLWHLWHEYDHITGEFAYPDASSWTNAELGIPADGE